MGRHVTRLDRLSLAPTGRRSLLGEYHDTYSFAPRGSRIAFGISAPGGDSAIGCCGRVGIRVINSRNLRVAANIRTGVYAAALAWLRPKRLVALLGEGGVVTEPPPEPPHHATVITVNPATGKVLETRELPFGASPFHCDAADARRRALIVLARRNLFAIGPGGGVRSFELPEPFGRCGKIALAPSGKRAFAVSRHGDLVAELALDDWQLILHQLSPGPGGIVDPVALARRRLVLAHRCRNGRPKGVGLIGLKNGSRRMIDRKAGAVRVVKGTALTYDGRPLRRAAGIGVRGHQPNGSRRFRLLRGKRVAKIERRGRFAYAIRRRGVAVIDVPTGRVVSRSSAKPPLNAEVLTRQSRP